MISLYIEDQREDSIDNAEWPELDLWHDTSVTDTSECFFSAHKLPTEQELLQMEADHDESYSDERLLRRERRTALRH